MGLHIVVIGGSAGSLEALLELTGNLPADLNAAILVVIHFPPTGVSHLPFILNRKGKLPAHIPSDGECIQPGHIYVAAQDYHLLIHDDRIRLTRDARENHSRPAIDPLFRSAAEAHGPHVIGVVLSGLLNDGTEGLIEIKRQGGIAIVQSPSTALFGDMPKSAILHVPNVDYILSPLEIADRIVRIIEKSERVEHDIRSVKTRGEHEMKKNKLNSDQLVAQDVIAQEKGERDGEPSIYSCPDCGGVLWQVAEGDFLRFRCHVGHAYSAEALFQQQSEVLESSMWYALRTVVDKARLARQLAINAKERGHAISAAHFEAQAEAADHHAEVIRSIIRSSVVDKSVDIPDEEAK